MYFANKFPVRERIVRYFTFLDFIVAVGGSISTVLMLVHFFGSYFMYNEFIKKLTHDMIESSDDFDSSIDADKSLVDG